MTVRDLGGVNVTLCDRELEGVDVNVGVCDGVNEGCCVSDIESVVVGDNDCVGVGVFVLYTQKPPTL